jgi:2,3-bisphosphoglycerate-dependent phosphoglycerate mutase
MWKTRICPSCPTGGGAGGWHSGAMSDLHCPARLIVARHGEAAYESGTMTDSGGSLTTLGRSQALALGERLAGERVAGVVCSELARAVQTAEIAAAVLGLPVEVRAGLQEFAVGDFLGRTWDPLVFDPMVADWLAGDLGSAVPGGESGDQVADRVLAVLDDVADRFRGETVLAVSHGGVVLALMGRLAPGSRLAPADAYDVPNCASYVLERDADGWRLG